MIKTSLLYCMYSIFPCVLVQTIRWEGSHQEAVPPYPLVSKRKANTCMKVGLIIKRSLPPISSWSTVWIFILLIFLESQLRFGGLGSWRINFLATIINWRAIIARLIYCFLLVIRALAALSFVVRTTMLDIPSLAYGVSPTSPNWRRPKDRAKNAGGRRRWWMWINWWRRWFLRPKKLSNWRRRTRRRRRRRGNLLWWVLCHDNEEIKMVKTCKVRVFLTLIPLLKANQL